MNLKSQNGGRGALLHNNNAILNFYQHVMNLMQVIRDEAEYQTPYYEKKNRNTYAQPENRTKGLLLCSLLLTTINNAVVNSLITFVIDCKTLVHTTPTDVRINFLCIMYCFLGIKQCVNAQRCVVSYNSKYLRKNHYLTMSFDLMVLFEQHKQSDSSLFG